jgi:transposase
MRWLFMLLLLAAPAANAAQVQARLIRASNDEKLADARLESLHPKLKKKFGYPYYQQMGERLAALTTDTTTRLDLGEGFVVFVKPQSVDKKVHELEIEWTSGRASIVKSTVKIPEGRHLFIKGPGVANDWIVLALTVRE